MATEFKVIGELAYVSQAEIITVSENTYEKRQVVIRRKGISQKGKEFYEPIAFDCWSGEPPFQVANDNAGVKGDDVEVTFKVESKWNKKFGKYFTNTKTVNIKLAVDSTYPTQAPAQSRGNSAPPPMEEPPF